MQDRYPLLLRPVTRSIIWGGTKLKERYNKQSDTENLAESWELTVRPDAVNTICNGPYAGMALNDYFSKVGYDAVSPTYNGSNFPLLIKFIDARDNLSIQVHPNDTYARIHTADSGKTEMWYIVDCDPGAQIIYGLKGGVTTAMFEKSIQDNCVEEMLCSVQVHPGETYFIPSGQVHAIGKGILIAEIQQNSDVTYRVYDYNRRQQDGTLRQLHTEHAINVTEAFTEEQINSLRYANATTSCDILADCPYFRVRRWNTDDFPRVLSSSDHFYALMCTQGTGTILVGETEYSFTEGDTYLIPSGCDPCKVTGDQNTVLLVAEPI